MPLPALPRTGTATGCLRGGLTRGHREGEQRLPGLTVGGYHSWQSLPESTPVELSKPKPIACQPRLHLLSDLGTHQRGYYPLDITVEQAQHMDTTVHGIVQHEGPTTRAPAHCQPPYLAAAGPPIAS